MVKPVQYHYGKFPPKKINWDHLIPLIGPANAALARFDGKLTAIPNAGILLSPLTTQEAVLSSKIEGTQATMGEVLEFEAEGNTDKLPSERKADINEILNYRKAMWDAVDLLAELPLCQRVIKTAHNSLLQGVRGQGKQPGEYRTIPNWIGPPGCPIEEARFVPISADKIQSAMGIWESYIHGEAPDRLVQLAILHAEFEALHPFLDGNGRLGRMCVPLFMYNKEMINMPTFYISAFFEANRDEYYNRLLAVSRDDDWTGWCEFFLKAVAVQASENLRKTNKILSLYETKKEEVVDLTRSQYAIHALDYLFSHPIFKASHFTRTEAIPKPTAIRILTILRENSIIKVLRKSSGRRPASYIFPELINIAEGTQIL